MSEQETTVSPVAEPETTPVVEEVFEVQEAETEEGGDALDDLLKAATGAEEATPDEAEVEYEGKTYKLPAELKDALLRQADYTRKTMDLAEQRKAIEAATKEAEELRTVSAEKLSAAVALSQAQQRLEQLHNTSIEGRSQEEINSLRLEYHETRQQIAELGGKLEQIDRTEAEKRQQSTAKAVQEARAEAAKHIPNFDARVAELGSFVERLGGDRSAVEQLADPVALRVLHLADIGQQFIERQRQAGKARAAQAVQPAAEVTGGKSAPVRKDLVKDADKMSADEWVRQREAELKKRG